jgi:competence transcription factor ComK
MQPRYLFFVKLCFNNIMSIIMKVSYMKSNNNQYHRGIFDLYTMTKKEEK